MINLYRCHESKNNAHSRSSMLPLIIGLSGCFTLAAEALVPEWRNWAFSSWRTANCRICACITSSRDCICSWLAMIVGVGCLWSADVRVCASTDILARLCVTAVACSDWRTAGVEVWKSVWIIGWVRRMRQSSILKLVAPCKGEREAINNSE